MLSQHNIKLIQLCLNYIWIALVAGIVSVILTIPSPTTYPSFMWILRHIYRLFLFDVLSSNDNENRSPASIFFLDHFLKIHESHSNNQVSLFLYLFLLMASWGLELSNPFLFRRYSPTFKTKFCPKLLVSLKLKQDLYLVVFVEKIWQTIVRASGMMKMTNLMDHNQILTFHVCAPYGICMMMWTDELWMLCHNVCISKWNHYFYLEINETILRTFFFARSR